MKSTALANSNIAFIKYWGKKDEKLIIPMNPSISMTLDERLSTKTTVEFSEKYDKDILILNNKEETGEKLQRVSDFLDIVRKKTDSESRAKVVSKNSFPTGAGIASSASGFAALAAASAKALELELDKKEISALSRLGSGSSTRSIYGGFVLWQGEYSEQLKKRTYWKEMRDMIIILDRKEKKVSSREAMRLTVDKSKKYKPRLKDVEKRLRLVRKAINKKDFGMLARQIMEDSNSMQECIEEIGINYLNKNSERIKRIIREINKDNIKAAYTFDAGPNVHIITLERFLPEIKARLKEYGDTIISKSGQGIRYTENHLF